MEKIYPTNKDLFSGNLEVHIFIYIYIHVCVNLGTCICSKIMDLDLTWVQMARYELIIKRYGATLLRTISGHPPKPKARSDSQFFVDMFSLYVFYNETK